MTTTDSESPCTSETYLCGYPECGKPFKTLRGKSVHEQRTHKSWYDERQVTNIVNKKSPWSSEEQALLARQEAHLVLQNTKFINQALQPIFPHRTLESIKGQRRNKSHKDKVLQVIQELTADNSVTSGERTPSPPPTSIVQSIKELFELLEPLNRLSYNGECLGRICEGISTWSENKISEELEIYLLKTFPLAQKSGKAALRIQTNHKITKRQARRAEYAKIQRAWKKNPCNCLRTILKSKTMAQTPAKIDMVQYWRTIMTGGTNESPDNEQKRPETKDIWDPVAPNEIKNAYPELSTSPGPDGLTAAMLRAVPLNILTRIFNLFLICGKLPKHLLRAKTTLIPKKDGAELPEDYRPITVQSIMTRTFHKVLAKRLLKSVPLDERQKAFLPTDGCAKNIFGLDMILKYHRQNFKQLYMASMDIAKAFDSVSHKTINETLNIMGLPKPMVQYIMDTYERSSTTLMCDDWESDEIKPACGVRQGDPLSPLIFNMVIDRLLKRLTPEVGVNIGRLTYNALIYADDMILVASTPMSLQTTIDTVSDFLAQCGLHINATKSFTVSIRNVPHMKRSVVDGKSQFLCRGRKLPALKRDDEWRYLGVPFTPEGQTKIDTTLHIKEEICRLTKAPLKPQQRLFALKVMVLPGIYHLLTLGNTTLSRLKQADKVVRGAVRKWLNLPHDTPNAYVHANVKDGGLSIPSMRWLMPLHRRVRLQKLIKAGQPTDLYITLEIQRTIRRLTERQVDFNTPSKIEDRWAKLLHASVDGKGLRKSGKTPQQHQWVIEGTRFLSGRDYINSIKLRINALPTRSKTARGRKNNRACRGGCNATETLNHVLQQCHRTHRARIERHNAIVKYLKRALEKKYEKVEEEPHFKTDLGLRKPDLVAIQDDTALVLDAQVVSEHISLDTAHNTKIDKYKHLKEDITKRYGTTDVHYLTATLSYRGVWSAASANQLLGKGILNKAELKTISTRALIGGLSSFWRFNRTTARRNNTTPRTGIG
ncbi:Retrovirus-related Pol polyprotein from type-2 retrotransposable element R2DM [Anthophora retusa]